MAAIRLTDAAVQRLKPGRGRREIADKKQFGLYLIIQPSGKKSWAVRYRLYAVSHKYTIGSLSAYGLAEARKQAQAVLNMVERGLEPMVERRKAKVAAANAIGDGVTIEDACKQFVLRYCRAKKLRSWRDTARRLGLKPDPKDETKFERTGNGIVGIWGPRPAQDIKRRDVLARLDDIVAAHHPISANLELATLRKFFGWCIEREIITENPCANIRPPSPTVSRDRVLSDDELKRVWLAAEKLKYPFGRMVQLLILTGQRRDEVAQMRSGELDHDGRTWTIPATRRKNKNPQVVPMPSIAMQIIAKLPSMSSQQGFMFTMNGRTAVSGYSKSKRRLDAIIAEGGSELAPWVLHDLRRTMATGLQRLGVRLEVTESVLGHTSGSRSGIVGIYQRHEWGPEKREALDKWASHVMALANGATEPGKVVRLRDKRRRAATTPSGDALEPG